MRRSASHFLFLSVGYLDGEVLMNEHHPSFSKSSHDSFLGSNVMFMVWGRSRLKVQVPRETTKNHVEGTSLAVQRTKHRH